MKTVLVLSVLAFLELMGLVALGGQLQVKSQQNRLLNYQLKQTAINLTSARQERDKLRTANEAFAKEMQLSREEQAAARISIEQLAQKIRENSSRVRIERQTIYRQPNCQELALLDIGAACPELADSMRRRAAAVSGAH